MAVPGPDPKTLGALLLLATALSAQYRRWDNPSCTEGVVLVPTGTQATMSCNISNTFTEVTLRLRAQGKATVLFRDKAQGCFIREGWQLCVHGSQAQLVIEATLPIHTGEYLWHLWGLQTNNMVTKLNVSEPLELEEATGPAPPSAASLPGSKALRAGAEARSASVLGVLAAVISLVLVLGALGWYHCHHQHSLKQQGGVHRACEPAARSH